MVSSVGLKCHEELVPDTCQGSRHTLSSTGGLAQSFPDDRQQAHHNPWQQAEECSHGQPSAWTPPFLCHFAF